MNNIHKIVGSLAIIIGALAVGSVVTTQNKEAEVFVVDEPKNESYLTGDDIESEDVNIDIVETKIDTVSKEIVVYVCGEVMSPGVYELTEGSRIYQLIDMAGGFTLDASTDYLNQADILRDGTKIYVPTKEEAINMPPEISESLSGYGDAYENGLININTASKEELMRLAGVGESKAMAIISYRQENGKFNSTQDIMQISGIKEGLYNKIKDYICAY